MRSIYISCYMVTYDSTTQSVDFAGQMATFFSRVATPVERMYKHATCLTREEPITVRRQLLQLHREISASLEAVTTFHGSTEDVDKILSLLQIQSETDNLFSH